MSKEFELELKIEKILNITAGVVFSENNIIIASDNIERIIDFFKDYDIDYWVEDDLVYINLNLVQKLDNIKRYLVIDVDKLKGGISGNGVDEVVLTANNYLKCKKACNTAKNYVISHRW